MNIIRSNDWINFFLHDEYFSQYFGISYYFLFIKPQNVLLFIFEILIISALFK